jgi:CheY-like chemotaxis protein
MDQLTETILVVGNDVNFQYLMRRYAGQSAYRVLFAGVSDDVICLTREQRPAVIILVIETPEKNSWDLVHGIKSDPAIAGVPLVVCSWSEEDEKSTVDGVSVYLHMPVMLLDFQTALAKVGVNAKQIS